MEQKTQNYITIGSFLVAFSGLAFTFFTRNQDQNAEFYEKEQQYRAETLRNIQSIKDNNLKALQAIKNDFNEYKLKSQELNFIHEKKIENLEIKSDHIKNQFEHSQSQARAENEVLEKSLKNYVERNFKKKND